MKVLLFLLVHLYEKVSLVLWVVALTLYFVLDTTTYLTIIIYTEFAFLVLKYLVIKNIEKA